MDNFNNVLFVAPNYKKRKGGIASVLNLYSIELNNNFLFCPSIYFQNIILSTLLFPINLLQLITKLLLNRNIRIVHIHGSHEGSFYRKYLIYLIAKKLFNKKVIYHIHASHFHKFFDKSSGFLKKQITYLINNVDLLIVLSEEWKQYFISNFNPKKVKILENVVAKRDSNPKTNPNNTLNLLFLGRIGERKGVFDLINVLRKNKEISQSKIKLHIGGDGEISRLKSIIKKDNLDFITFHGWVGGTKKNKLLESCNVFILPSFDEGLPISILEAMSYKKPIISTRVGGIPGILKSNYNGILITPGNEKEIWNAIKTYFENPDLLTIHGENSYKIAQNFFPETVLTKLNIIYSELI